MKVNDFTKIRIVQQHLKYYYIFSISYRSFNFIYFNSVGDGNSESLSYDQISQSKSWLSKTTLFSENLMNIAENEEPGEMEFLPDFNMEEPEEKIFLDLKSVPKSQRACFICKSPGGRSRIPKSAIVNVWLEKGIFVPMSNR